MSSSEVGRLLALAPDDEIIRFFRCKKTEISSCMFEPLLFLNHLRDYNLVPDDLYQKVLKMKRKQSGVDKVLESIEMQGAQSIKEFWSCVFHEHIKHKYPFLRSLQICLFVSCRFGDLLALEIPTGNEQKKGEQRKCETKSKRSAVELEEDAGSSSVSSSSQNKHIYFPQETKEVLHIICGDKRGILYPDKLAKGNKCINYNSWWFTPRAFERFAGKGKYKNWKLSIRCRNTPLQKLIKEGRLKCPRTFRVSVPKKKKPSSVHVKRPSHTPQEMKEVLHITCGDDKGLLYPDKLAKGNKCIKYNGCWFTPPEFEKIAGKGNNKNWKVSIRWRNTTLRKLIKEGRLKCPRIFRVSDPKKKKPSSVHVKRPSHLLQEMKEELHITCGDKKGILYPDKLAKGKKCIKSSRGHWFTPPEFERYSGKGNYKNWKLSIRYRNNPLQKLIKEGRLKCPRSWRVSVPKKKKPSSVH